RTKSGAISSISSHARKVLSSSSSSSTKAVISQSPSVQAAVDATPEAEDETLDTTSPHIRKGLVDHSLDDTWLDKLISALLVRLSQVFGSKY
ncbi:hypothetical protein TrRE_jg3709, partial [Triparma retinervis]